MTVSHRRLTTAAVVVCLLAAGVGACGQSGTGTNTPQPSTSVTNTGAQPRMDTAGWVPSVYQQLTERIEANAGQDKVAIFDFDNTVMLHDVGEAALAQAVADGTLKPSDIPKGLVPPIKVGESVVKIKDGIIEYYDALAKTGAEAGDEMGSYVSAPWIAQVFAHKNVDVFVQEMAKAYANGVAASDLTTGALTTVGVAARPTPYPQMADLLGYIGSRGYQVWIVSAGITWAVRWMVANALNPMIAAKYGTAATIEPGRVIGITTMMATSDHTLMTDRALSTTEVNPGYLALDSAVTKNLTISELIDLPVSWYGGKVAAIKERIGATEPFLVAGDSPGDMKMLEEATNRLWIARLEKSTNEAIATEEIRTHDTAQWLIQPTLSGTHAGFLSTQCALNTRLEADPVLLKAANQSVQSLATTGQLGNFEQC